MSKRSELSNRKAQLVCRELRFQMGGGPHKENLNPAVDLLIDWLKFSKKDAYVRPPLKRKYR